MTLIDPQRCPLCGHANECGAARGKGTCWCFSNPIPEEVLEKIPAQARGLACVCNSCALGRRDPSTVLERMQEILRRHR